MRFRGCRSLISAVRGPAMLSFALLVTIACLGVSGAAAHPGLSCLREIEAKTKERKPGPNHEYVVECWDQGRTCTAGVAQKASGPPAAPIHDLRTMLERCFEAKMPARMNNPKMPQDTIFMNRSTREGCTLTPIELKEIKGTLPHAWAFLAVCHAAP
jgi:hypothetical protein